MVIAMAAFVIFFRKFLKKFTLDFVIIFRMLKRFFKRFSLIRLIEKKFNWIAKLFLFKNKRTGIAVLEASLTLPVILMMIFFIIEMMKVNNTRTAMDSMALEASLDFVSNKNTNNFNDIIKKYKPSYIGDSNIKYYFAVYESLDKMCAVTPFGSEEVFWPSSDTTYAPGDTFVDSDGNSAYLARNTTATSGHIILTNYKTPETSFSSSNSSPKDTLIGRAFVLTFVCDYKFSSSFIGKLFVGGANTKDKTKFLIWGRGVGICN